MEILTQRDFIPKNIFEKNYEKISNILPNIDAISSQNIEIQLIPQLKDKYSVQLLSFNTEYIDISFSHYILENNDLIPDPEFVLRTYPNVKIIEVLQYQDRFGIQKAYHSDRRINPEVKVKINHFLGKWLELIIK